MSNISINGESLKLHSGKQYFLIDALYIDNIRQLIPGVDNSNLEHKILAEALPYAGCPYAKFYSGSNFFDIKRIKKISHDDAIAGDRSFFVSDTGVFVLVQHEVMIEFAEVFSFGDLFDFRNSSNGIDLFDKKYWDNIEAKFQFGEIGLIIPNEDINDDGYGGGGTFRVAP